MAARLVQIAMNARDDSALGQFWAEALGWSVSSEEPGVTNLDQAAEVARLRALGAIDIDVGQGDDVPWTCLADPEGNEFDVLAPL